MAIKLTINGFDELLKEVELAGGSVDKAVDSAIRQSAQIMQGELKSSMKSTGVSNSLIQRMPNFTIEQEGNRATAHVGYTGAEYNPRNLADIHKAIFANYGTPHRKKHGIERPRGFVAMAKKKAKPKIKKQEKMALEKIISRLK